MSAVNTTAPAMPSDKPAVRKKRTDRARAENRLGQRLVAPAVIVMLGVTAWVAAFFRDPIRSVPQGKGLIVSPADGLVTMIQQVEPPFELGGEGGYHGGGHTLGADAGAWWSVPAHQAGDQEGRVIT